MVGLHRHQPQARPPLVNGVIEPRRRSKRTVRCNSTTTPGDNRLELFGPGDERLTRATHEADIADIRASYYGNRIAYTPEDAPWFATDGDPSTAWRAAVFEPTVGLIWEADLTAPVTSPTVTVLQPTTGATDRFITEIRVSLDDTVAFDATLDERSRVAPGQPLELPDQPFETLRIEVLADNVGELNNYAAQPGVGFAEVTIAGLRDDRAVAVPGFDAFEFLPPSAPLSQRLTYVLTRERIDPATANRTAPEPRMVRRIDVAQERSFDLVGEVRLAGDASEETLLAALDDNQMVIADQRLRGNPGARGASAFDGDRTTAWQTPFDDAVGATVRFQGAPTSLDSVTVSWLDDGQHSVPTQLTLTAADGSVRMLELPALEPDEGLATATIAIDPFDATDLAVTVSEIEERTTPEDFSGLPRVLPVGIAEIQLGDASPDARSAEEALDASCRDDLVTVDGEPVPVRLIGSRGDALAQVGTPDGVLRRPGVDLWKPPSRRSIGHADRIRHRPCRPRQRCHRTRHRCADRAGDDDRRHDPNWVRPHRWPIGRAHLAGAPTELECRVDRPQRRRGSR